MNLEIYKDFKNCPFTQFSKKENWDTMMSVLEKLQAERRRPVEVFPIIHGKNIPSEKIITRQAPQEKDWLLANIHIANNIHTEEALKSLEAYFPTWRDTSIEERVQLLERTSDIVESRRLYLAAIMILEEGKTWVEADADVAEGIDFLRYYAIQAQALFKQYDVYGKPEEKDLYSYEPRGVCVTIGPWNFPLAIPCGMFSAALVTGNTVVMKPAEQSSWIAWELFKIFLESGMPPQAAAFLPGYGEEIGDYMVKSPRVSTIVFTGSKSVGLSIIREASNTQVGQVHVKRVIAEMGGKNSILIDSDADLDKAVEGVVRSAFNYAGQKCSACSRAIVVEEIYERFIERLKEYVQSLTVGPSTNPDASLGPVIDEDAYDRLLNTIEESRKECKELVQTSLPSDLSQGYYVPPIVFTDVPKQHVLCQKELFGPILVIEKTKTFEEGLQEAINSEYALTGAVFSRSPKHLELAQKSFRVGNLYLNRGCTGALVGRHPFGGAYMSGVGSKAGGPDYLNQFVLPRLVCIPQ